MQNKIAIARLNKEYQNLRKQPPNNILAVPQPNDLFTCHFILHSLEHPYQDGVYHGSFVFPSSYPNQPPKLYFHTPNGRFKTNSEICLSFTNFHKESWSPQWNIERMLLGIISVMYGDEMGTGMMKSSVNEKIRLAKESYSFNMQQNNFKNIFGETIKNMKFQVDIQNTDMSIQNNQNSNMQNQLLKKISFFGVMILVFGIIYHIIVY